MTYLRRIFPWLLLAPVLLPVVVWGGLIYPYLVPKTLLFYALSFLAAGVFAVLVAYGHAFKYARLSRWEAWIPGALLVLAYIASYFGIDLYRSFWSLFVRGDGLLMLSCVTAVFYMVLVSADRAFFTRLLRAVAAVASFVAVYGVGEWVLGGGRIGGLLGNAAFFAGYLGIALFATLSSAETMSGVWRKAAYGGAAFQVIAIVLSATRGTMLALGVALVAWLIWTAFRKGASKRLRTATRSALALLALSAVLFIGFRSDLARVPFEPVSRIASISITSPDIANRLFIWKNMLVQVGEHPWLGVGAEHINVLFNTFYDPTQISEEWFDRSHNAFLDYAAQYGIGGLILYLLLVASFVTTAWRFARRGDTDRKIAASFVLLALVYAVQNFFVFDTISSFWLLVILLAALLAVSEDEAPASVVALPVWTRPASWVFALMLIAGIGTVSVQPAIAAYDLAHAYLYQLTDVHKEVAYLSHGIALGTYGTLEYGYQVYSMYGDHQAANLSGQDRVDAYQAAVSVLENNFRRFPYDARTALYLAHVLSLAPPGVQPDSALLSSALERAISLSSKRAQPWYILVNLSISNANSYPVGSKGREEGYAAAHDIISRYIALVPALSQPYFVAAQLDFAMGNTVKAMSEAALGKKYYKSDLKTASRAAVFYENANDLPDAAFFLGEIVRMDPANAAAASDLAKIKAYESR